MPSPPSTDPIFHQAEPEPGGSRKTALLWQYFFFPVLIVLGALGLFLLFGLLGRSENTPEGLLDTLLNGSEHAQQQAAQQLAILITEARSDADRLARDAAERGAPAKDATPAPPFYRAPAFRKGLLRAFTLAKEDGSPIRQRLLARALGRAQVDEAQPALLGTALAQEGAGAPEQAVRRAAAAGLLHMESRQAEAAYLRLAAESDDVQVRVMGYNALALLGLPQHGGRAEDGDGVMGVLLRGLEDPHGGVRLNAAYALALRGDARARDLIKRSLDREGLAELGVRDRVAGGGPTHFVQAALLAGIRGAAALGDSDLKPLVQRLADPAVEGDDLVRQKARAAVERWPSAKQETDDAR